MRVKSLLSLRVHPGQRESAAQAFVRRRVLEECAEAIPGFFGGALMLPHDDPDLMCVSGLWDSEASYRQWLASPLRAAQGPALAGFLAQVPFTALFDIPHSCVTTSETP